MIDFLLSQGIDPEITDKVVKFRESFPVAPEYEGRIPKPEFFYYGKEVWEKAITALLAGESILLVGPKATGKNVLAENLSALFNRPQWDISFYLNTDAASLIGNDTFKGGEVCFRPGPVTACAKAGGFAVLDEINMAKNESLAVLHATLDFRRIIEVSGYDRIQLRPETRFIGTMNYGYAGTRELNEALASRFMVINVPVISGLNLKNLLVSRFPGLKEEYSSLLCTLFDDIRAKCESSEISTKALDLRGLVATVKLCREGLNLDSAIELGLINKCFDRFERTLVGDMVKTRVPKGLTAKDLFK